MTQITKISDRIEFDEVDELSLDKIDQLLNHFFREDNDVANLPDEIIKDNHKLKNTFLYSLDLEHFNHKKAIYLKTHKTGSTTMTNIMLRYALNMNLKLALRLFGTGNFQLTQRN